jgi:predicted GNAT family acetyltransferase
VTDFIEKTHRFRSSDQLRTNMLGSIAATFALKDNIDELKCFWIVVVDSEESVIGAALRTGDNPIVLSPLSKLAASELAAHVTRVDPELPGVTGPTESVETFIETYVRLCGARVMPRLKLNLLLYELGELRKPTVPGYARRVEMSDFAKANEFLSAFVEETNVAGLSSVSSAVESKIKSNLLWFWIDGEDEVVAMGGHALLVDTPAGFVGRIGPIYTRSDRRKQGYGSAITAHLAELLLNSCSRVMLFADAANPSSNSVYLKLGFNYVDNNIEYDITHDP